ncbi:MAG: 50S ribosomal protein L22 [Planctomycetes bacterium]|nr:50S ribosomal protein L22 [Planctomycetota bacterium]
MAEATKREFKASARNIRMSARKARLVMDAVRGRDADEAVVLLQFVNKRAAPAIKKLIESAVANAEEYGNRNGIDIETDNLVIAEARVDEGPRMKRWRPRSRGMANPFTRYTCHLFVTLAEPELIEERAKGRPAFRKPRQRLSREERMIKTGRAPAKVEEKAEKKADKPAEAKAEKKPAKKAEAKAEKPAEKKPAKKAETKSAKKADDKPAKKAEKKTETKSAKKSEKKSDKKK